MDRPPRERPNACWAAEACGVNPLAGTDPGFTLRAYTHLLPSSQQRTRQAVDRALAGGASTVDGLTTAQEPD
jgi:hypothetical protein